MHAVTQEELNRHRWFHGIDFGNGLSVKGRISETQPQNYTLFGIYSFLEHIDLQGQRALDIGTSSGLMAFILKKKGAAPVIAADINERSLNFELSRKVLGYEYEIEFRGGLDIQDRSLVSSILGENEFDFVNFSGVLYHLLAPLESLFICRSLLRRGSLICVGTCYDGNSNEPTLRYNMGDSEPEFNEPTTYFLPTLPALLAMLRSASFDPLAAVKIRPGTRWVNVLARAVRPSEVRGKTPLQRLHDDYVGKPNHHLYGNRFHRLEHGQEAPSSIRYTGPEGFDREIDIYNWQPAVPFQPRWSGGGGGGAEARRSSVAAARLALLSPLRRRRSPDRTRPRPRWRRDLAMSIDKRWSSYAPLPAPGDRPARRLAAAVTASRLAWTMLGWTPTPNTVRPSPLRAST